MLRNWSALCTIWKRKYFAAAAVWKIEFSPSLWKHTPTQFRNERSDKKKKKTVTEFFTSVAIVGVILVDILFLFIRKALFFGKNDNKYFCQAPLVWVLRHGDRTTTASCSSLRAKLARSKLVKSQQVWTTELPFWLIIRPPPKNSNNYFTLSHPHSQRQFQKRSSTFSNISWFHREIKKSEINFPPLIIFRPALL